MKQIQTTLVTSILLALCTFPTYAIEMYSDEKMSLNFEGNLAVYYLRNSEGEAEVNDGFSRYIFDMKRNLKGEWQGLAKLEWGVQLSNTNSKLIVNNNTLTSTGPATDSIWLRQGYVGLAHSEYGQLTMGKQWGVSYDIGGVTDWFEIFGGIASGTYNFGTDGGFSGTGRAEQAIQYRNKFGNLSVAAQFQASEDEVHLGEDETTNVKSFDGTLNFSDAYGFSVLYEAPYTIELGIAYNKAKISLFTDISQSQEADDELLSAFVTYGPYNEPGLHIALVYADMKNHDINDVGLLMTKATGIELFSAYRFDNDISLILGYMSLEDTSTSMFGSNGNYHNKYAILGARYHFDDDFYLFFEGKLDSSTLSDNSSAIAEDAAGVGMMYTF